MVAGSSSKFSAPSEVDISGEGRGSKRLITDTRDNVLTSSANAVLSNDDLLIEILLLLPAISLLLYKSVSKQWLSVITCPTFTLRLSQKPNIDPPSGLFVRGPKRKSKRNMFEYDFISFDIRIPSKISTVFTFSSKAPAKILQSCNGLLLCYITPDKFFVYNPCVNLFKMLPRPQIYVQPHIISVGIRLVFDPTKSPHYKVVHAGLKTDYDFDDCDGYHDVGYHDNGDGSYLQIETYSSKIGSWSVCVNRFDLKRFNGFELGIYSNSALHWLTFANGRYWHAKLDILFFESRGFLLLVCKDDPDSRQLNIFEMRNGYSECYTVDASSPMSRLTVDNPLNIVGFEHKERLLEVVTKSVVHFTRRSGCISNKFWCHSISGAKLSFADVTPLFEFGTKSLAPPLSVLLCSVGTVICAFTTSTRDYKLLRGVWFMDL
ncbi:F-box protein-like protein isoform X1 [Tanacetum coccineum]